MFLHHNNPKNLPSEIVKERYLTDTCRAEMEKLIDKDFAKYKAQGIVEKMINAVMEISTYRKTVSILMTSFLHIFQQEKRAFVLTLTL